MRPCGINIVIELSNTGSAGTHATRPHTCGCARWCCSLGVAGTGSEKVGPSRCQGVRSLAQIPGASTCSGWQQGASGAVPQPPCQGFIACDTRHGAPSMPNGGRRGSISISAARSFLRAWSVQGTLGPGQAKALQQLLLASIRPAHRAAGARRGKYESNVDSKQRPRRSAGARRCATCDGRVSTAVSACRHREALVGRTSAKCDALRVLTRALRLRPSGRCRPGARGGLPVIAQQLALPVSGCASWHCQRKSSALDTAARGTAVQFLRCLPCGGQ